MDIWSNLGALVPSIGVLTLFIVVVRAMIMADRRERVLRKQEDSLPYNRDPE